MDLFKRKNVVEPTDEDLSFRPDSTGDTAESLTGEDPGEEPSEETVAPVPLKMPDTSAVTQAIRQELTQTSGAGDAEGQMEEFGRMLDEALQTLREETEAGEIGEATVMLIARGLDYRRAVERADAAGELRGRNTAIEEHLESHDDSDGIPHPGCGQGASPHGRSMSIFDLARMANM